MKNTFLLFVLFFSLTNAQVSERIKYPKHFNSQLGRSTSTLAIEKINNSVKEFNASLSEANESYKLYKVSCDLGNAVVSFDLKTYIYDTYLIVSANNYYVEDVKIINGERFFTYKEMLPELKTAIDKLVLNSYINIIKTEIWR